MRPIIGTLGGIFGRKPVMGAAAGLAGAVLAVLMLAAGWLDTWEARTWDWRVRTLAGPGPATVGRGRYRRCHRFRRTHSTVRRHTTARNASHVFHRGFWMERGSSCLWPESSFCSA